MQRVILDTNVFVAAGFKAGSASADLIEAVRAGPLVQVWNAGTRDETHAVLARIPRLDWEAVTDLFGSAGRFDAALDLAPVDFVADPADRKFAALSLATGTPLVSADADLLSHPDRLDVWRPGDFRRAHAAARDG